MSYKRNKNARNKKRHLVKIRDRIRGLERPAKKGFEL